MYIMAAGTMEEKSLEIQTANQTNSWTKEEMACIMCSYGTTPNSHSVFRLLVFSSWNANTWWILFTNSMFSNYTTYLALVAQVFKSLVQIALIRTAHANRSILVLSLKRGALAKPPEKRFIFLPSPKRKYLSQAQEVMGKEESLLTSCFVSLNFVAIWW